MGKPISAVSLITALIMTACVTINIYFPAAAAEKAADKIIKEIQETAPETQGSEPQSTRTSRRYTVAELAGTVLDFVISPAHAEADLSIDSPTIRKIQASMAKRFNSLRPYYSKGFIGIMSDGFLSIRDITQVPLKDRNRLNKLVAAENRDRSNLYRAIADANGHPEWRDD
ncbi:MAG: DUF1318 domain-containing protein, partial [Pseudomonadota bacterium]